MPNEHIVFVFLGNEATARTAADSLENWDKSREDIKLGACGVIVEKDGKIKRHVSRWGGRGRRVEAVIGVVSALLTGGVGIASGAVAGGGTGSFFHSADHLTERDFEIIVDALHEGKAILLTTSDADELVDTAEELKAWGGEVSAWELPEGTLGKTAAGMAAAAIDASHSDQ